MKSLVGKAGEVKEIFCGIDLHWRSMLAAISLGKGEVEFRSYNTMAEEGVAKLVKDLQGLQARHPGSAVWAAYEASGCGFGLVDRLREAGFRAEVLAPSHLPVSQKSRSEKTDKKDALRVLDVVRGSVLAGSLLPKCWVPPLAVRQDRELVRRRLQLGESVTKVKNRIHGFLKRWGIRRPEGLKSLWTQKYVRWLVELGKGLDWRCGVELESLVRELGFYQEEIALLDQELARLSEDARYDEKGKAMMKLKGVGLLTAMVFLTELGDVDRFGNRRALANYLGLTPRSHESGEQDDRKGHISRLGPARVRKVLNQAAWCLVRCNRYWHEWYHSRTDGHPGEKKRKITAVMRRLAILLWHRAKDAGVMKRALGAELAN